LPLHLQKCFNYQVTTNDEFAVSNTLANETIALPIYPGLKDEEVEFVVNTIKSFFNN